MTDFSPLNEALKQAKDSGVCPVFWWRDDDATGQTFALEHLLTIRERFSLPLAMAVVPAKIEASLEPRLRREQGISVLVHGLSHANHAPADKKKAEFGPHRPLKALVSEASAGLNQLSSAFGDRFVPAFVPPWNRIDEALIPRLSDVGYVGWSTFGNRPAVSKSGLVQINTHLDPIAWHRGGSLVATDELLDKLTELILQRIRRETDEPIGILTHHLVQDQAIWDFCENLLEQLLHSEAIRFTGADCLFQSAPDVTIVLGGGVKSTI